MFGKIILFLAFACGGFSLAEAQSKVMIRGQVIFEPTGKPLKNVRVELIRPDRSLAARVKTLGNEGTPETLGTTRTDPEGKFSFETTRPGPYEIMCFLEGGHIASGNANVDPRRFVLIEYKADPTPVISRPPSKKH